MTSFRYYFSICMLIAATHLKLVYSVYANETLCKSIPTEVIILQDRAEIIRESKNITVPVGVTTIVFENIRGTVYEESLQVKGMANTGVSVDGIAYKKRVIKEPLSEANVKLKQKIDTLKQQREGALKKLERLKNQKNLIFGIDLTQDGKTGMSDRSEDIKSKGRSRGALDVIELYKFIASTSASLDDEILLSEQLLRNIDNEIQILQSELQNFLETRTVLIIEVYVRSLKEAKIDLAVQYQVEDASWHPEYMLIGDEKKNFTLETYGIVSQRTGEIWDNVKLTLSTARPGVGMERPEPVIKLLNVYEPVKYQRSALLSDTASFAGAPAARKSLSKSSEEVSKEKLAEAEQDEEQKALAMNTASVKDTGVVTFEVEQRAFITGDGTSQKLKLTSESLESKTINIAVPEQVEEVYSEAQFKNTTSAPLMNGEVAVLIDGRFIGKKYIPYVSRGEEFKLPLGVSDELKIKRTIKKSFTDTTGIISSQKRISKEYSIEVQNVTDSPKNIIVLEGYPVSQNEKIKVNITEVNPEGLKQDNLARINTLQGVFEWHILIPSKSKSQIKYKASAEYPEGVQITGAF
jgi:uncharacterized protein (TIGR02231 family)